MLSTGSPHKHTGHIDVASVLGPTTRVHAQHLDHPQAQQEYHSCEGGSVGVLEGVGEPAVVARLEDDDFGLPERIEVATHITSSADKVGRFCQFIWDTLANRSRRV